MDWADEIEIKIADEYGSHGAVLAADADGMIAAALRKAKADGEASGERKGRASGMREAADMMQEWPAKYQPDRAGLYIRASQIEKGQT